LQDTGRFACRAVDRKTTSRVISVLILMGVSIVTPAKQNKKKNWRKLEAS